MKEFYWEAYIPRYDKWMLCVTEWAAFMSGEGFQVRQRQRNRNAGRTR